MALNLTPFQQQILQMRGVQSIDKPGWGPPDMSEQIQKGIASLYGLYQGAEQGMVTKLDNRKAGDLFRKGAQQGQGASAAGLAAPGGPYAPPPVAPGALPTEAQGGYGPDNPAAAPTPASTAAGGRPAAAPSPQEVRAYYRDAAVKRGIDPDVMERVVQSEGGWDNVVRQSDVRNAQGVREQSYGPLQLYLGGGLGNEALARGIDPRDPNQWRQAADFALEKAAMVGWSPWKGAAKAGIGNRQGLNMSGDTGLSVATADQPSTIPPSGPREATVQPPPYATGVNPVVGFRSHVQEAYPGAKITSDYRSPEHNARVGGAKNSQHTHGTALDLNVSGMSEDQKAALVDEALARGAKGIGWYNDGSLHIDFREGQAAAWGPNRSKTSLGQTAPWFRQRAERLLATGGVTPAPATAGPNGNVAQAQPQVDPRAVIPQAQPDVAAIGATQAAPGGPGGPQAAPQAQPNPTPVTQASQPLFPTAPAFSDPLAGQPGPPPPQQQPYDVAGPAVGGPARGGPPQPDVRLPPGHGISIDPDTGQRMIVNDQGQVVGPANPPLPPPRPGTPPPPPLQPQRQPPPQQPQQPPPQGAQAGAGAGAGGTRPLPPQAAAAASSLGINPEALQGANPYMLEALGYAIHGGDPQMVSAIANGINAVTSATTAKAAAGDWTIVSDGRGGFVRHNKRTNEVLPVGQQPGTQLETDLILKPGDPRRKDYPGIPDDNKTYRVRPTQDGRVQIDPLDERESKTAEHIISVSNSLESNETFKQFRAMHQAVDSLEQSFKQGNAAGDLNAMVQVFKVIDPQSTVSTTESGQIQIVGGTNAMAQYWKNKFNLSNGTMTKEMRAEFMNAAKDQMKARSKQALEFYEGKRRQAKTIGLKDEEIDAATNGYKPPDFSRPRYKPEEFVERDTAGNPVPTSGDTKSKVGFTRENPHLVKSIDEAVNVRGYYRLTDPVTGQVTEGFN